MGFRNPRAPQSPPSPKRNSTDEEERLNAQKEVGRAGGGVGFRAQGWAFMTGSASFGPESDLEASYQGL